MVSSERAQQRGTLEKAVETQLGQEEKGVQTGSILTNARKEGLQAWGNTGDQKVLSDTIREKGGLRLNVPNKIPPEDSPVPLEIGCDEQLGWGAAGQGTGHR